MTVEYGVGREVWFAPVTDLADKSSFLVRDDAYSKSGAIFGRQFRIGEPTTLGPNSTWRQTTWEGGYDQKVWSDTAMYELGTADTLSDRGKVKLWESLGTIYEQLGRVNVTRFALGVNASGLARSDPQPLLIGESNPFSALVPAGGFRLYRKDPGGALTTLYSTLPAGVASFSPADDNSVKIYFGLANGDLWAYNQATGVTAFERAHGGEMHMNSMAVYQDSLYYLAGRTLNRRTNTTGTPVFTDVYRPAACVAARGMAVWNNRLWFGGLTQAGNSRVFAHDGISTVEAFQFPDQFHIHAMKVHYGSLYICGSKTGGDRTAWMGQVWRYNGASLVKVYEAGNGEDGADHTIWDMATDGRFLAWTISGVPSNGNAYGMVMYDAENDSIALGPNYLPGAPVRVHSIESYDQTLNISAWAVGTGDIAVRPVRKLGRVRLSAVGTVSQFVKSSRYDGEVPGEQKVWLTGRVRCKIALPNSQIVFKAALDEGAEQPVATVTYDASKTGWRTVTFPMKVGTSYLRSAVIQYVLYLENTSTDVESVANPEVDSVEIDFLPSPVRRRQWRLRAQLADAQLRLDGVTPNPLTTTEAQLAKLEELWSSQVPVAYWDARSTGGTPSDADRVEVFISEFMAQPFRLDTDGPALGADVALSVVEVVQ